MRISLVSLFSFFLCYCIYISFNITFISAKCLEDQQSLLLQLKNNLTFELESSTILKLWNESIACCDWIGVTCDGKGFVIGLDLSGESISGGFDNTSSLFSLQHLQKLNLADNNFNSVIPSGFNKLEMLTYLNMSYANFVGQVPSDISQLTRLITLDISSFSYDFIGQNLHKLVQNLSSIRQLYLDGLNITGQRQEWCNALLPLRNLQELSMSYCELTGPLDSSLSRLENLSSINFYRTLLSSSVPESFANFKILTTLNLAFSGLAGIFPQKIFQIETLSFIDLSFNYKLHGSFPEFPQSGSIKTLRVSNTSFYGALPNSIGNLRHLTELDLYICQFNGTLPNSLSNLTQLRYLDLSYNSFSGPLPSFNTSKFLTYLDLSHNRLQNLVNIYLNDNSINGSIPSFLFTLPLLENIILSFNHFSNVEEFTIMSSSKLNIIDLSNNDLSGSFPTSILQLGSLSVLDVSSNRLNGSLQLDKFLELRNLTYLDLSFNNFSINVNVENADQTSFNNIATLNLASCNIKTFPSFLRNNSSLANLDLSYNQIQGTVPNWIWKLQNLQSLNISHNFLTDLEGPLQNLTSNVVVLDLHNNQLKGPIPFILKDANYLDYSMNRFGSFLPRDIGNYRSFLFFLSLSNNSLYGNIPDSICNALNLRVLDLSINNISGTIPSCLMSMTETLVVLNLKMNNLKGFIPDEFPPDCVLRTLDLKKNKLDGKIPKSLVNCSALEVLDLANNNIHDKFPCMLKNISTLRVLVLRQNRFYGTLRCQKTNGTWHKLQIVDIAFYNFSGKLPGRYFTRWEAMMSDENQDDSNVNHLQFQIFQYEVIYYENSVTVSNKGQQMELKKILTIFTTIDFSSNNFEGPIPEVVMDFKALYVLNFSNNAFSGEIPSTIGNLKQLESLDLSNNSLVGEIPVQLGSLSFLSYLNLSFNHLVGKIPTGTQLQSFPVSSFEGNDGLYGSPLIEKPNGKRVDELYPQPSCRRLACSIEWNFVSVELGFIFGLGIIIGPLMFLKQWRISYWKLVNKILCWIFPCMHLEYATHRGQSYTILKWKWQ
uniref:Receptor-like protein 7 n=1 Tax=Cicer arietinum TaxID=3827 RepID=A0A1S2Z6R8_CICAR|nr:receptor-like protein 7 [Cicer arietinum]